MKSTIPFAFLLLAAPLVAATPTEFTPLSVRESCDKCVGFHLPGRLVPADETKWMIHSDLPELFTSDGVLYGTVPVLPPFNLINGDPLSESMRTQVNRGFTTVDDSFEVFFFHTTMPPVGHPGRRIVLYVRNNGEAEATLRPRQAITTDGLIGTVHEMENNLAKKVMSGNWDVLMESVTIAPGEGTVIAAGKVFSAPVQMADSSTNRNSFGIVQAQVEPAGAADLDVFVLSIPAAPIGQSRVLAERLLETGANSGEAHIDLSAEPSGCQVRRATGVFSSVAWASDLIVIDAATLTQRPLQFPMAVPAIQSMGCPAVQQTSPMLMHSRASRPDTVGNYMIEYQLAFQFINTGSEPAPVDVRFGKDDADIGLAWQHAVGSTRVAIEDLRTMPPTAAWAGPKQTADLPDDTRTFLTDGKLVVAPGESIHLGIRFMIVGNSSLPFNLVIAAD